MIVFVINVSAPTVIYPYGHTLSRHDAPPICWTPQRITKWRSTEALACLSSSPRTGSRVPLDLPTPVDASKSGIPDQVRDDERGAVSAPHTKAAIRSEERRVGKE